MDYLERIEKTLNIWRKYAILSTGILFITAGCLSYLIIKASYTNGFREGAAKAMMAMMGVK